MMKYGLLIALCFFVAYSAQKPAVFERCIACHGEQGQHIAPGSKGNITIAGLSKQKVIADLRGYRAKTANNGGAKNVMYIQAQNLSDEEIEALASYISTLPKAP